MSNVPLYVFLQVVDVLDSLNNWRDEVKGLYILHVLSRIECPMRLLICTIHESTYTSESFMCTIHIRR